MNILIAVFVSYLLGTFPTALFVVKTLTGQDVRSGESGNLGAMNTLRMVGKYRGKNLAILAFLVVWIVDMGKAVLALLISQSLIPNFVIAVSVATTFVVIGHNYPVWLKGKGGRGAASFMGILLYFNPLMFLCWVLTVFIGMLVTELVFVLIQNQKVDKKFVTHAVSEQILGRLIGELSGIYTIFAFDHRLLLPAALATMLIILRHRERLKKQLKQVRSSE